MLVDSAVCPILVPAEGVHAGLLGDVGVIWVIAD